MHRALFRVDAGSNIGLGHLQRSLALAGALKNLGVDSIFVTDQNDRGGHLIARYGFDPMPLRRTESWTLDDLTGTLEIATRQDCGAIIVDSHVVGERYLTEAKNTGSFVVVRDDLALYPFTCNIVFNGNADGPSLPYQSSSGDTVFLLGTEFIVLRQEFQTLPERTRNGRVANIMVVLGGADHHNLMPRILSTLYKLPGDFDVTAVIGPYFTNEADIRSAAQHAKRSIKLVSDPEFISELMIEADLAISAGGQTLYELATLGCPTIAIRTASNQDGQLKVLEDVGFVRSAGDAESDDVMYRTAELLSDLLSNAGARAKMRAIGQRLVDGKGAQRVATEIFEGAFSLVPN